MLCLYLAHTQTCVGWLTFGHRHSFFRLPNTMSISLSAPELSFKKARKLPGRLAKVVMKSHRVRIPKYDLPIRLRPVSLPICIQGHLHQYLSCSLSVVSRFHLHYNDNPCVPGLYKLFKSIAFERQALTLLMLLHRNRRILLYYRRGRVRFTVLIFLIEKYSFIACLDTQGEYGFGDILA